MEETPIDDWILMELEASERYAWMANKLLDGLLTGIPTICVGRQGIIEANAHLLKVAALLRQVQIDRSNVG